MRFILILLLVFAAGCETRSSREEYHEWYGKWQESEMERLQGIYRASFERGFLEAWAGHGGIIETLDQLGLSSDPDPRGDNAMVQGYRDGQRAGSKARLVREQEQSEKTQE